MSAPRDQQTHAHTTNSKSQNHTHLSLPPGAATTNRTHPHRTQAQCPTTQEERTVAEVPLQSVMVMPFSVTELPCTSMPPAAV